MSGIAEVLVHLGHAVSGSDLVESPVTDRLRRLGVRVETGHDASYVGDASLVVVSTAVPPNNPERLAAGERRIPVMTRGAMLAELTRDKRTVAIVGSHGKTTTAAMASLLLLSAGLEPTAIVGGYLREFGSSARLGTGPIMVVEADESDRSFLELVPEIAVLTNLDEEHLDAYGGMEQLEASFREFAARTAPAGCVVACGDDPGLRPVLEGLNSRIVTYAIDSETADVRAHPIWLEPSGSRFQVGSGSVTFELAVPGRHNVLNALAAVAVGLELGVPPDMIRQALADFSGAERRFQTHGEAGGVVVIDDYAHHPTEIAAVLETARLQTTGRLRVVFQPHRYTRTLRLLDSFAHALAAADDLVLMDVYPASETPIPGATADALADAIAKHAAIPVRRVATVDDAIDVVSRDARRGDVVLTLGAGSIGQVPARLLDAIRTQHEGRV